MALGLVLALALAQATPPPAAPSMRRPIIGRQWRLFARDAFGWTYIGPVTRRGRVARFSLMLVKARLDLTGTMMGITRIELDCRTRIGALIAVQRFAADGHVIENGPPAPEDRVPHAAAPGSPDARIAARVCGR
jgi:hypothetical protein